MLRSALESGGGKRMELRVPKGEREK